MTPNRFPLLRCALACLSLSLAVFVVPQSSSAGPFINLGFEQATVVVNDPIYGLLDWNLALPGWSPPSGQPDSSSVFYGIGHLGLSQYIMLTDGSANQFGGTKPQPLSGEYSLVIRGSLEPEYGAASVLQTGDIPASAKAIELLVRGDQPEIYLGETQIPLAVVDVNGSIARYAGNISAYAGTTSQLRISYPAGYPLPDDEFGGNYQTFSGTIDNIQFTTRIIPEPTALMLAALGTVGWFAAWRRSRRRLRG